MKNLLTVFVIFGMLTIPFAIYAQSDQQATQAPPVAPALVPEGDFAMKLVVSLKMGAIETEAQAEDMLSSVGIAPRNGWIADYPVTPDIIGELQKAVVAAADSNKLPIGRDEALKGFQDLTAEFGLAVVPDTSGKYSENQPPTSPEYVQPNVIDNYYYDEGPPVVTYYPPPWDYYYLYAWVPYPFWWGGFFFSGFFCLHDFHRVVVVGHHRFVVTNHAIDPINKAVVRVDPASRRTGRGFGSTDISHHRGFNSTEARRGATSIFERSASVNRVERDRTGTVSSDRENRTFSQPNNIERRNERNFQRPSGGQGTSSSTPSVTHERSFNAPSMGSRGSGSSESSGRTFSAPSRSFSPPSTGSRGSSGEFHAGGGGHSFGHGGFSGGFGHGGCRGRC